MKVTELYYLERLNLGNYSHSELSATAILAEGEDEVMAIMDLKALVHSSLNGTAVVTPDPILEAAKATDAEQAKILTVVKEKKKPAAKKQETLVAADVTGEYVVEVPPVIEVEVKKPAKSKAIVYDSNIPEHKSIFGGYLAKKYDSRWKTASSPENIKKFTSSLNGKEFIDNQGQIVPTFLNEVHQFFGA